jgi:hypothetical protein
MDKAQLKAQGLTFGRSVQTAFKAVVMYAVDHPAAGKAVEQAYDALRNLLQLAPQFTFGFSDHRVLLNDLLTDDPLLGMLQAEFGKRGIAAITFPGEVSRAEFQQALRILAAKPKEIEAKGGIAKFIAEHPIGRVRVVPVKKQDGGDTVLDTDAESYLRGDKPSGSQGLGGGSGLEALMRFAQMERASSDALPDAKEILALAGKATEAALVQQTADPREVVDALAQLLRQIPPEHLLSALPSAMQTELRGRPVDDLAASVVEDATVGWIATHLAAAPAGPSAAAAEEQAIRVMTIGLTMTQATDRLLEKLARILEEAHLPPETYQRIRHGVLWGGLSESERRERLLQAMQYDDQEFQGLLDYIKECLGARKYDPALEVANHYFRFLDASSSIVQAELPRALQLLRIMAEPPTLPFLLEVAERLGTELLDEHQLTPECHAAVADALAGVVRLASAVGDLDPAHRAGTVLEHSRARDPRRHEACCGAALGRLLPPEAASRLIDVYLEKRGDAGLSKTTVELLRWLGSASGEEAFRRLAEEAETPRRPLLLRLLTQLGPAAIEPARRRLGDARWSVARDACSVLGDLDDPELPQRMQGALRHPEGRVQQAAVAAMVKSRAPGAMAALADALPVLEAGAAEKALEELSFRKDPATIDGLERFLQLSKGTRPGALDTAVRVVAVISTERAARVLGVVLSDPAHAPLLRRTAGDYLLRSSLPIARRLLEGFVRRTPDDPIAAVIQKALPRDTAP